MSEPSARPPAGGDWESSRRDKLRRIAELGYDPWGSRFDNHAPISEIRARAGEIVYRPQDGAEISIPDPTAAGADFDF
ncbi:MAG TPA: lysine--tRNA ligase, partial [Lacipirellulaceae bacterium]|nr:lysine--tRNA ligase [Lacipirellulaceae bacterium]